MYLTLAEHEVSDRFIPVNIRVNSQQKRSATQRDAFLLVGLSIIKDALALAVTSASKELQGQINAKSKLLFVSPSCGEKCCANPSIYLTTINYHKI